MKGLLPTTGIVLLAGQSAAGKTFLAQSLAGAGATGGTWFGRKVRERFGTLFLCGEGVSTFPDRLEALRVGQIEPAISVANAETGELPMVVPGRLPIAWSPCDGLRDPARMAQVTEAVLAQAGTMQRDHGVPLGVIVVDTLAATVGLDDENNASECTLAMKALEKLSSDTGALVVAIAHFGKTEGTGVRGSSALTASADTILAAMVEKDDLGAVHTRKLALTKSRYAETGWHQPFKLRSIVLGEDEDGDAITSCCIEPVEAEEASTEPREARLSPGARAYVHALGVVIGEHGSRMYPFGAEGPEVVAVDQERVRDEFYASWSADGETEAQRQEARRRRFNAGRKQAVERQVVGLRDLNGTTYVWPIGSDA